MSEFVLGGTNIAADWRRRAAGAVEATLRGRSLELSRVRGNPEGTRGYRQGQPRRARRGSAQDSTRFVLQLDRVMLQDGSLGSLTGTLDLNGDRMVSADLSIGAGKGGTLKVTPGKQGRERQSLCRRLRRAAEGDRLARRAVRRLSRLPRADRR